MPLTREAIVDAAMGILREYGLADLSMRRLARDLDVQPGALYWHVKNKQELLTVLAGLILAPVDGRAAATARDLALAVREALLSVRDGAEVVALAHALKPDSPPPLLGFGALLAGQGLPAPVAEGAGRALVHYVLGSAMEEQTRAGFSRAGLLDAVDAPDGSSAGEVFVLGLELFLAGVPGLAATSAPAPQCPPESPGPRRR
ncbi:MULTISPECIES: TetR family transcriptional regulator [unclassified Arthrobacter]|uniref:TetR family transcriptional regulator n=1 Tax=unclassified Arthrobacter TaxID=235627 RepID=UPI00159E6083|nr:MULTISPECIES: TetR family transcriptional regulator [unclassified Arthrobacter]MCQ9165824.1 TetR family transcriptional regulator [Arthrobacter sp. STN4]NVM99739.1 TetR family transcriptional regulator [Arthrobacter sp. SDTb3-6]